MEKTFEISLSPKAENELSESWDYYEDQQRGLGGEFITFIISKIDTLRERPARFPIRNGSYRWIVVRKYPYLIIFRVNQRKRKVTVTSVFHASRNPKRRYKRS